MKNGINCKQATKKCSSKREFLKTSFLKTSFLKTSFFEILGVTQFLTKTNANTKSFGTLLITGLATSLITNCQRKIKGLLLTISKTNHVLGHRLWAKNFPKSQKMMQVKYVIVGGGISGLSAAREFTKQQEHDFLLLELETELGGNSNFGENQYSKYPLGAHYLPLPNLHDHQLIQFLHEENIITGFKEKHQTNVPIFDELQLTFAPHERIFYKNTWHDGLIAPAQTQAEKQEIESFFQKMDFYRHYKDSDGRYAFDIPIMNSSKEQEFIQLDGITMKQWCDDHHYHTGKLLTYIDYCCRDDFGLGINDVSAWAGIHYFASRKNKGDAVLTWPEGNARLTQHLKKYVLNKHRTQHLVHTIHINRFNKKEVLLEVFDAKNKESLTIKAEKVIIATPQYVTQYLLPQRRKLTKKFEYAPWLLATLVVSDMTDNGSIPLSWDNIIYGAKGLGYVNAQQQSILQVQDKKVITYYYSFADSDTKKSRQSMYRKTTEELKNLVFDDLKIAHPDIEELTESIEFRLLGHGMISPKPHFIFGEVRHQASLSIADKIFFAHSDLSGISIFEEAFHQGIRAVHDVLKC